MVEFCTACGTSLPKGDLTFKEGEMYTSNDYLCPECGKPANPAGEQPAADPEPDEDQSLIVKDGEVSTE